MSSPPRVRLLSTGSEILQGLYPDTNAQRLSQMLMRAGFKVVGHGAAPDSKALLSRAIDYSVGDADLVVITGGLGPTVDDLTRDVAAETCGLELQLDERAEAMMRERFAIRGVSMPEKNIIQAMLPLGSIPLYNHWGTASGFLIPPSKGRAGVMALPGPPSECLPMMEEALKDVLPNVFPSLPFRISTTIHCAMTPESIMSEQLCDLIGSDDPMGEVTILANRGHLRLHLTITHDSPAIAKKELALLEEEVIGRIGGDLPFAIGGGGLTLSEALIKDFTEKGQTIATAESCTGGWIAKALTDIAGSSGVVMGGAVAYSNSAKIKTLGVAAGLVEEYGAVSEPVARAMAEGARVVFDADWAVATTGIAGPGGGSQEKPVGTVWFAVAGPDGTITRHRCFPGSREAVREYSVNQALEFLRRAAKRVDLDAHLLTP